METYLLTLLVTFEQEYAIQKLFGRHGWKFDKIDKTGDAEQNTSTNSANANEENENEIIGHKIEINNTFDDDNDEGDDDDDYGGDTDNETSMDITNLQEEGISIKQEIEDDAEYEVELNTSNYNTSIKKTSPRGVTKGKGRTKASPGRKKKTSPVSVTPLRKSKRRPAPKRTSTITSQDEEDQGTTKKKVKYEKKDARDTDTQFYKLLETLPNIEHFTKVINGEKALTSDMDEDDPSGPPADVDNTGYSVTLAAYFCPECGYTFPEEKYYSGHKRNGKCMFPCQFCDQLYSFRNFSKYQEHLKTHSLLEMNDTIENNIHHDIVIVDEKQTGANVKRYTCKACTFTTMWYNSLVRHRHATHRPDGDRLYVCPACPYKKYRSNYALKDHNRIVHGYGLMCTHCSKVFRSRSGFQTHIQKINGQYKFKCEECSKTFQVKNHFEAHMNKHRGYVPHQCTNCKVKFTTRSSLGRHLQNCGIVPKKRYQCEQCSTMFSSVSSLRVHQSGLHGNKLYVCKTCGRSYKWANSYYRHIKSHK